MSFLTASGVPASKPAGESFITIHPAAPPKPLLGAPCNGCGACCAAEPCPISRFLLGHDRGACPALTWRDGEGRYFCGMVLTPAAHLRWLPLLLQVPAGRLCRRWIATGSGCDFDAEIGDAEPD
jgi:hypothetical protein